MQTLRARISLPIDYSVLFTRDVFAGDNPLLADLMRNQAASHANTLFVLDEGLGSRRTDLDGLIAAYVDSHHDVFAPWNDRRLLVVPGGERVKNGTENSEAILERIDRLGIDRHGYVIGIGGGAVLDATGFAAAVAHRGVRHLRLPSTTLAQNDAGIGVKNGINRYGKKNFCGVFMPPHGVINDAAFLDSQDDRDFRAGFAEAVKVALVKDPEFFDWIEAHAERLVGRDPGAVEHLVHRCAALHLEHICQGGDPFEQGASRPLDFGHWSAHRLERMSQGRIRHGEAVAVGIALDAIYSRETGLLRAQSQSRIQALLSGLGFALDVPELACADQLLRGLQEFREHIGGPLTIMLLAGIGCGVEVNDIDAEVMRRSLYELYPAALSA